MTIKSIFFGARRGFLLVPFAIALAWFALSPARALLPPPPPDGGYLNQNTAVGDFALHDVTTGDSNTAIGHGALTSNTTGDRNTATGNSALESNNTGRFNTATGSFALLKNTTGIRNTATGASALFANTTGGDNTAIGVSALFPNTTGTANTATGSFALFNNTTGGSNTATGFQALQHNTTGNKNTALGNNALQGNTTGGRNIALGNGAGKNLTTGNDNIDIGNEGFAGDANIIRIGTAGTHLATLIAGISGSPAAGGVGVIVNTKGRLGTILSSARFKDQIKPMDQASEAILALKPVTFRYKHELDPAGIPQFGLIAEQVEKVNPDLVARDGQGKVNSVRYEAVNAMLLNEFLKEHRKVQELEAALAQQQKDFAQQEKEIKALAAGLKALQIQKVSGASETPFGRGEGRLGVGQNAGGTAAGG